MTQMRAVMGIVLFGLLMSCGRTSDQAPSRKRAVTELGGRIFLDPALTDAEYAQFLGDYEKLSHWRVLNYRDANPQLTRAYETLFRTANPSPQDYLLARVTGIFAKTRQPSRANDEKISASNIGFALWMDRVLKDPRNLAPLRIADRTFPITSSRAGIIILGKSWAQLNNSIYRMVTLIHEGRHSDCPDGITEAQISQYRALNASDPTSDALGTCGFTHIDCPVTHELAGLPACEDPQGWGAYAVEATFAKGMYTACENCTETERTQALAIFFDGVNRIPRWRSLADGVYGNPDMRQQGYRSL